MKIIFAGTPQFAVDSLELLSKSGHEIVLVLTQPDRCSGRGMQLTPSPIKKVALELNLPIYQPVSLKIAENWEKIKSCEADLMVVAAYGLILPEQLLKIPRFGCINVHASLLPRWRGAAPIQRAILAGDQQTGVCIMQMSAGLDEGDVLASSVIAIDDCINSGELTSQVAHIGAELLLDTLAKWPVTAIAQNASDACYAKKITKDEAKINWQDKLEIILRQIRAYNPFPGAHTSLKLNNLPTDNIISIKIWEASIYDNQAADEANQIGKLIKIDKTGVVVQGINSRILIKQLQKANGKKLSAQEFFVGLHSEIESCYFV